MDDNLESAPGTKPDDGSKNPTRPNPLENAEYCIIVLGIRKYKAQLSERLRPHILISDFNEPFCFEGLLCIPVRKI